MGLKALGSSRLPTLTGTISGLLSFSDEIRVPQSPQNNRATRTFRSDVLQYARGSPLVRRKAFLGNPTTEAGAPPDRYWQSRQWHKPPSIGFAAMA